jgi:hypothetical protein
LTPEKLTKPTPIKGTNEDQPQKIAGFYFDIQNQFVTFEGY